MLKDTFYEVIRLFINQMTYDIKKRIKPYTGAISETFSPAAIRPIEMSPATAITLSVWIKPIICQKTPIRKAKLPKNRISSEMDLVLFNSSFERFIHRDTRIPIRTILVNHRAKIVAIPNDPPSIKCFSNIAFLFFG